MSIELDCPLCDRQWKVRDDQVNRRTSCPDCDEEYYVPEKLGARAGSGRWRDDDEEEETTSGPGGLSKGALIGIGAGVGGFLLIAVIATAVMLSRRSPRTAAQVTPGAGPPAVAQGNAGAARPPEMLDLNRSTFHRITFDSTRSKVEEMLGQGTPIAAAEMRESLATDGCQFFCPPALSDKICNSPTFAFYKWKKDQKAFYAAFDSKEAAGVLVCAVYMGPDVLFNKTSEFRQNPFKMNAIR